MLKLSLLGPPLVERAGEPAGHFVSTKALALLCYLAMHDGPQVREHLAGLLWGEMPEERAKANLRMALYNLQKLLPGSFIITRLTAAFNRDHPYWLDVEAFNSGLTSVEEEIASLQADLDLYRGEFLEGLYVDGSPEFDVWLWEQREHLKLSFLYALEKLADHYKDRENWVASIEAYRRLLTSDALREDVHRRLMLVLARAGRYESALEQYETCRRVLLDELHVEPAPETKALCERIKNLRRQLKLNNLPVRHDPLLGRENELMEVARLLRNPACRLITLIGPGGIGKSRLALQAAVDKSHEGAFLEGVYFVQLAAVASPDLLVSAIADAVHFAMQGPANPIVQLCNYLRNKEMLLVLDNFEHLINRGTMLLTEILTNAPDVTLMLTSRTRLNLRWEWLLEIQGLHFPKPAAGAISGKGGVWKAARNYPAVRLFSDRAQRVESNFSLSEKDIYAVVRICQLVEGMPLGIELAASWVNSVSCIRIAEEIEHNLGFLSHPHYGLSERHRSMQAVFDNSWRIISNEERAVFKKLSVFRGGFQREAAERVAKASLSILSSLVDKSFLHHGPDERFTIHELLRQYGEEKLLTISQDLENTRNFHCKYFASFLHERENHLKGGNQNVALKEIGLEIDNIRAAWGWAVERKRIEEIEKAIEGLWAFYELRGWYHEGEEVFDHAANRLGEFHKMDDFSDSGLGQIMLGAVLARLGWFCWHQGRYRRSSEVLQQGLALLPGDGIGAKKEKGFCLLQLGIVNLYLGSFKVSKQYFQESLKLSKEVGDNLILVLSLNGLCFISLALGDYDDAKQKQEEGIGRLMLVNDRRGIAHNLIWFGWSVCIAYGEFNEAERMVNEGMEICQNINDKFGLGLALKHFGALSYLRGDYANAKKLHQKSRDVFQEIGDQWGTAYALNGLGYAEYALGKWKAARSKFCESLKISADIGTLPVAMEALVGLATLLHDGNQGEKEQSLELLEFVLHHPSSEYETKNRASQLIVKLKPLLPSKVRPAIKHSHVQKTLDTYVVEFVGETT